MGTATEKPAHQQHGHQPHAAGPKPIDPERDIDARKTVFWLTAALVFVIVAMWALAQLFNFSLQGQQMEKIDRAPTVELDTQREQERAVLQSRNGKSIDDTIKDYLGK